MAWWLLKGDIFGDTALLDGPPRNADGNMEDIALFSLTVRLARNLLALAAEHGAKAKLP